MQGLHWNSWQCFFFFALIKITKLAINISITIFLVHYISFPLFSFSIVTYSVIVALYPCPVSYVNIMVSASVIQDGLLPNKHRRPRDGWLRRWLHLFLGSCRCTCCVQFSSSFFSGKDHFFSHNLPICCSIPPVFLHSCAHQNNWKFDVPSWTNFYINKRFMKSFLNYFSTTLFWQVTSVSYHPKDECMVTASVDGTIRVWKAWEQWHW